MTVKEAMDKIRAAKEYSNSYINWLTKSRTNILKTT